MKFVTTVFCFSCIVFSFFEFVGALKSGEDGVCVVTTSVRKTRIKYVKTNKWCGKKKCVVKKNETYTVPQKQFVCCKGYVYDAQPDICKPICSTGCEGGKCTAPETCSCDPPMYLDPQHTNICRKPICEPACVNSVCVSNNTCQCDSNYTSLNSTYCFKCEEGYVLKGNNCEPICSKECNNGFCSAPETCTCLDGFETKDDHNCEPSCNCINSTCIAPNICECFDGYEKSTSNVCVPKCENCTGECIGPDLCRIKCTDGYYEEMGVCKPVCDKCENGYCKEPNVCACNQGYVKNADGVCTRDCSLPDTDINSTWRTQRDKV